MMKGMNIMDKNGNFDNDDNNEGQEGASGEVENIPSMEQKDNSEDVQNSSLEEKEGQTFEVEGGLQDSSSNTSENAKTKELLEQLKCDNKNLKEQNDELKERNKFLENREIERKELEEIRDRVIKDFDNAKTCMSRANDFINKCVEDKRKANIATAYEDEIKRLKEKNTELEEKCKSLDECVDNLTRDKEKLEEKELSIKEENEALKSSNKELQGCKDKLSVMINFLAPLAVREEFATFANNLFREVSEEEANKAAHLLFASLIPLSLFGTGQIPNFLKLQDQFEYIGNSLTYYLHEKQSEEKMTVETLRMFAEAISTWDEAKKEKIEIFVPDLGDDFDSEKVQHIHGGSKVKKVLNWCILSDGGVLQKAKVE